MVDCLVFISSIIKDLNHSNSERRIIYDYEKFGDSPTCLGDSVNLDGVTALVQGYGLTEKETSPNKLLETYVTIISNKKCQKLMDSKLRSSNSKFPADAKEVVAEALPDGLNNHMLCTSGIRDQKTGTFSVSAKKERKNMYIFWI